LNSSFLLMHSFSCCKVTSCWWIYHSIVL
jgi:hypothetical protein